MDNKVWCKHIKYWSRAACSDWDGDYPACNGWNYIYGHGIVQTDKWKFCPICGTPKPKKLTKKQQAIKLYHENCAEYGIF